MFPRPRRPKFGKNLGVTQRRVTNLHSVSVTIDRNREQGRKVPDPAARSLLTIFDREPEAAMRALGIDGNGFQKRDD